MALDPLSRASKWFSRDLRRLICVCLYQPRTSRGLGSDRASSHSQLLINSPVYPLVQDVFQAYRRSANREFESWFQSYKVADAHHCIVTLI
jgi:hypothetical protein